MSMFQPQYIICTSCHFQGLIVTEDIQFGSLNTIPNPRTGQLTVRAQVECPDCQSRFDVDFEWRRTVGEEMLFECLKGPNTGLEMWRCMVDGRPKQPVYKPNIAQRSEYEQELDEQCKRIADDFVGWKNNGQIGQSLEDLLGQVEDYTKGNSWNNFRKKHQVVVVCGNENTGSLCQGFNGMFKSVHHKNQDLLNAIQWTLHSNPEERSNQFCKNLVGHCAEVHATNSYLYYEPLDHIANLKYSMAYLIRNAMPRSYCMNCIALFRLTNA